MINPLAIQKQKCSFVNYQFNCLFYWWLRRPPPLCYCYPQVERHRLEAHPGSIVITLDFKFLLTILPEPHPILDSTHHYYFLIVRLDQPLGLSWVQVHFVMEQVQFDFPWANFEQVNHWFRFPMKQDSQGPGSQAGSTRHWPVWSWTTAFLPHLFNHWTRKR